MTGVNRVILVGNLGKDPEVSYGQSGTAVCKLRLAVNERRKDGDTWKDHVEWVPVVTFGKTAENAGQYLKKGRQVFVEGRMETREYVDKQGVKKWSTEVIANQIVFLAGGDGAGAEGSGSRPQRGTPGTSGALDKGGSDDGFLDDSLPF